MIRAAMHDLMDRMPGQDVVDPIRDAAVGVTGVSAIEKLHVRKTGTTYRVTLHVQTDGTMSLDAAHALGGRVKRAICARSPRVSSVLVHMEPYHAAEKEYPASREGRTVS
jgi:ferrous-iron efflux pump FieF